MQNRDVDNPNLGKQSDLEREPIGRKGGNVGGSTSMQREGNMGQNVRQGWNDFRTRVRGKWTELTDRDLDQYQGRKRDDLVNFIGDRVGGDRNAISRDVDTIARDTNYRFE